MSQAQRDWIDGVLGLRSRSGDDQASGGGGDKAPPSTDTDLFFAKDSSTLTKSARDALDRIAKADLAANATSPITIEAWASTEGDQGHNTKLAGARAQAVADYLAGQGIAKDRLKPAGKGTTDSFSKDDPTQNRRATLSPAPPATPSATAPSATAPSATAPSATAPSATAKPSPGPAAAGDPHAATDKGPPSPTTLTMRDPTKPKDPLGKDDAVKHVAGDSTDVPRDQVQRLLEQWLKDLGANQPNMNGKVRASDIVAEAERRLRLGLPGVGAMRRGDDKDYDPAALAKTIADALPPTVPAENVANFRKMSNRDAPKDKSNTEHLHDKYVEERDAFVKKFPEKVQSYVRKGLDAAVEKGVPFVLDKAAGATEIPSKLQGEAKDFVEKWTKKVTGNEDADDK